MKIRKLLFYSIVIFLTLGLVTIGCTEKGVDPTVLEEGSPFDPSKPVVFNDFSPKEGAVRTRVFIEGSNFGTDVSKIKVTIGGKDASVIGCNGTSIYLMVPPRATDGDVKVTLLNAKGDVAVEHEFDSVFNFKLTTTVSTLTGKIDPSTNSSSMIDGNFEEAEFEDPWWIEFDKTPEGQRMLYVVEPSKSLRRINLDEKTVSTVFTNGQAGMRAFQTMTFNTTRDTMFFADDHGRDNREMPVLHYSIRGESFRKVYPYIYDRTGYSCAQNKYGDLFYNTWFNAGVLKARGEYDAASGEWVGKRLFNINANNNSAHTYIIMHPDGLYAYLVGANCVSKSIYNPTTKELTSPTILAGSWGSGGYSDAPGTQARFEEVRQGVFVKNETYVAENRGDVYDFYLCDLGNHCIRKITPEGLVSTFAGRGSQTSDNNVEGWIDGDVRETARFRRPSGICYDEENAVFYIADRNNKRIRSISIE
ncbi:IPT/TIG domain-containing protein [Dysgonomonas sp. Marseille-P4361]|uniref:IPT/TIG domain-containing protein n=1 Tax=Dysgonomonas sp. Marseille-P4361 TaxID=2161820 RepID=UPI000D561D38|nr:IPT/TIG domain-containing protein [Dysgonomonas sp. Marseille-P4361]